VPQRIAEQFFVALHHVPPSRRAARSLSARRARRAAHRIAAAMVTSFVASRS
jgi:hypothetical protein